MLSQMDMMLAALARQQKLVLLTTDRDFEALPDLAIENWIVYSGRSDRARAASPSPAQCVSLYGPPVRFERAEGPLIGAISA